MNIKEMIKKARIEAKDSEEEAEAAAVAREGAAKLVYAGEFAKAKNLSRSAYVRPVLDVQAHALALKAVFEWAKV